MDTAPTDFIGGVPAMNSVSCVLLESAEHGRSSPRCSVNAAHCLALAMKVPSSTDRYRVLTVWERRRLKRETLDPDEMHTAKQADKQMLAFALVEAHCDQCQPAQIPECG